MIIKRKKGYVFCVQFTFRSLFGVTLSMIFCEFATHLKRSSILKKSKFGQFCVQYIVICICILILEDPIINAKLLASIAISERVTMSYLIKIFSVHKKKFKFEQKIKTKSHFCTLRYIAIDSRATISEVYEVSIICFMAKMKRLTEKNHLL